jgi:hypothetical protein
MCGETDWRCLEAHHVAGQRRDQTTLILCANDHMRMSEEQRDHPNSHAPADPFLDRVGHFLLGLADMLRVIVDALVDFGNQLIAQGQAQIWTAGEFQMIKMRQPSIEGVEDKTISIRAFAQSPSRKTKRLSKQAAPRKAPRPSEWAVIVDTETTTDLGQHLRFGTYQVREGSRLHEAGVFCERGALTTDELELLSSYTRDNKLNCLDHQ